MPKNNSMRVESGKHSLNMSGNLQTNIKYAFSAIHISAANMFAKKCFEIEKDLNKSDYFSQSDAIRGYVTGSIVLSVAALEAYINEIFINIRDGHTTLEKIDVEKIVNEWETIQWEPTLGKFKIILKYSEIDTRNESSVYFFPSILIKVRDGLLHYKPKWDYEKTPEEEMESQMRHLKGVVTFSRFISESAPLFPMRCMTHSFAKWAIETTLDFIEWFEDTAGLDNRFEQYREGLVLETQ